MDYGFDIFHAVIGIILAEITECLLQFSLDIGVQFDAGGKAPEDVRRDSEITVCCQPVAFLADTGIYPKNLRNDDDCRLRIAISRIRKNFVVPR